MRRIIDYEPLIFYGLKLKISLYTPLYMIGSCC